jgi:hypothetical protein
MSSHLLVVEPSERLSRLIRYISDEQNIASFSHTNIKGREFSHIRSFEQPVLIDVNSQWIFEQNQEKLREHIKRFETALIFYSKTDANKEVENYVTSLVRKSPNIVGVYELGHVSKNYFQLRNQVFHLIRENTNKHLMKSQLLRFGNQMNEVTKFLNKELLKIKKIHEKVFPTKLSSFKGLKLTSKFEAGISSGGEFFDVVKTGGQVLIMMSSCDSYLKSTSILSLFSAIKERKKIDNSLLLNLIKETESQFYKLSESTASLKKNGILLLQLDLTKLQAKGYIFGEFTINRGDKHALIKGRKIPISHSLTERAFFSFNLDRGMKLLITSPGLKKNWTKLKKDVDLDIFSSDHLFVPSAELINEIFYQIKREVGDDFLELDSSALLLEVDKHAIAQV